MPETAKSLGTILVVDDDPGVVESHCFLLGEWGYSAMGQTDPRKVLADLERHPEIGLVLLDIQMPEINGVQLLRQIKERHPAVGVILVTVIDDLRFAVRLMEQGAFSYIDKPFPVEQLAEKVKEWFRTYPRGARTRLGDIIRKWREAKKMSLGVAARKIGVSRGHLSKVERGIAGPLSPQHIRVLSQCIDIDESHLVRIVHAEKLRPSS